MTIVLWQQIAASVQRMTVLVTIAAPPLRPILDQPGFRDRWGDWSLGAMRRVETNFRPTTPTFRA